MLGYDLRLFLESADLLPTPSDPVSLPMLEESLLPTTPPPTEDELMLWSSFGAWISSSGGLLSLENTATTVEVAAAAAAPVEDVDDLWPSVGENRSSSSTLHPISIASPPAPTANPSPPICEPYSIAEMFAQANIPTPKSMEELNRIPLIDITNSGENTNSTRKLPIHFILISAVEVFTNNVK